MKKNNLVLGIVRSASAILLSTVSVVEIISTLGKLFFLDMHRDEKSMIVFNLIMWISLGIGAFVNEVIGTKMILEYFSETGTMSDSIKTASAPIFKNININPSEKSSQPVTNSQMTNTWQCPNCGRVNQNYVGTCGCGTRKP